MNTQASALMAQFARAMKALPQNRGRPLAVGFSGGGDSLALLALTCAYAQKTKVHALIVDHALRPQSALEARQAADMAKKLGAQPQILRWKSPRAGQNHARNARYALLAGACRALGASTVHLAHTLNDQEETFGLRLARGSSARGLACMSAYAPMPVWPQGHGLWLARPLLGIQRQELRNWLNYRDLDWIEDPSNRNRRYARVRWREKLATLHQAGLDDGRIARSVQLLGNLENQCRDHANALLASSVQLHRAGYAKVHFLQFVSATRIQREMALAAVMAAIAGTGAAPLGRATVHRTAMRLMAGPRAGCSAAGCRLTPGGDHVLISRDPGAVLGRSPARQMKSVRARKGQQVFYDNRFAVIAPHDGWIEALGPRARALSPAEYDNLMALPATVRPTVPVLRDEAGALTSPILGARGECAFLGQPILSRKLAPFSHITG